MSSLYHMAAQFMWLYLGFLASSGVVQALTYVAASRRQRRAVLRSCPQ